MNSANRNSSSGEKSAILRALHRLTAWLYAWILSSAIGRYFTDYKRTGTRLSGGWLKGMLRSKRKRSDRVTFRIRQKISATIENSWFCRLITAMQRALLRCSLNSYGIFLLFFGCYSIVTYYVTAGFMPEQSDFGYVITGGFLILGSLPLFASGRSLAYSLRTSRIFHGLLIHVFGIGEERFRSYEDKGREHYLEALFAAVVLGTLTFRYPPYLLLAVAAGVILFLMIMRTPEVGLLISVGICPLLGLGNHPTVVLLLFTAVTLFSFVVKLLCGKRVLRVSWPDAAILLLMLTYLFGGIVTRGGRASLHSALTYTLLMTVYFMVSNLVRTQEAIQRMVDVLIASCVLVALGGVGQYLFGNLDVAYLDTSLFSDLGGRVYATWENPNMLAEHLVLILPLILGRLVNTKRLLRGFGYTICFGLVAACLIFTWSRGAWLGAIVSMAVFFLCLSHRSLSWGLLAAIPAATLIPFIPERIIRRFVSIGSLSDSSVLYRLNLWRGVKNMLSDHWMSGIGVGESAFCTVYSRYALPGIESAMHSHSLYLQLVCCFGLIGGIIFITALLLWLRRALEYYRYGEWREPRLMVLCGIAGALALLVMGLFDDVFYNYRIFFLFWMLLGIVTAQLRIGEDRSERAYNPVGDEKTQGEVTFRFH